MATKHAEVTVKTKDPEAPPPTTGPSGFEELTLVSSVAAQMLSRIGGLHADAEMVTQAVSTAAQVIREAQRQLDGGVMATKTQHAAE